MLINLQAHTSCFCYIFGCYDCFVWLSTTSNFFFLLLTLLDCPQQIHSQTTFVLWYSLSAFLPEKKNNNINALRALYLFRLYVAGVSVYWCLCIQCMCFVSAYFFFFSFVRNSVPIFFFLLLAFIEISWSRLYTMNVVEYACCLAHLKISKWAVSTHKYQYNSMIILTTRCAAIDLFARAVSCLIYV